MSMHDDIKAYVASLAEPKRSELQELHLSMLKLLPKARLWFLDGKASVTGYCIKFKKLADIDLEVLNAAIVDGVTQTSA